MGWFREGVRGELPMAAEPAIYGGTALASEKGIWRA